MNNFNDGVFLMLYRESLSPEHTEPDDNLIKEHQQ